MSMRVSFFLSIFTTLAALHVTFIAFRLYDSITWLDVPVHLFGGAVVGLGLLVLMDLRAPGARYLQQLPVATASIVVVVLAWEVLGYLFLGSSARPDYLSDTIVDIVAGFGGGMIGLYLGRALAVFNE